MIVSAYLFKPGYCPADLYNVHRNHIYNNHQINRIMQTRKSSSAKPFIGIAMLTAILLTISCKDGHNDKTGDEAADIAKAKVKPPQTDIHTAVLTDNTEALNQHISAGTDINEKDPFGGSSPLITASLFGKTAMARILIDAGANLNFQNNDGSTPLHTAAFFCRTDIVRMLLAKGADKSLRNKFGATPYESVIIPFGQAKNSYDMMGKILGPMGLKLDYPYIEKTRPEIAAMLK